MNNPTLPLPGPYQVDLENYIEHIWDNGRLERHEKSRLNNYVSFALLEIWRNTLTRAANLICPLCRSGHKVYFDEANNYFHTAGQYDELVNPCEANAIWQERNKH